jgi:hypothetical protein
LHILPANGKPAKLTNKKERAMTKYTQVTNKQTGFCIYHKKLKYNFFLVMEYLKNSKAAAHKLEVLRSFVFEINS